MDAIHYSNNETFNSENFHVLEKGNSGKSQDAKCMRDTRGGSLDQGSQLVKRAECSPRHYTTEHDTLDVENNYSKLHNSEVISDKKRNSLKRSVLDLEALIPEASPTDNCQHTASSLEETCVSIIANDDAGESCSSGQENSQDIERSLDSSDESEVTTSDEDSGGDYTVSKYYESKLSRQDEAQFGFWKIKRAVSDRVEDTGPVGKICAEQCVNNLSIGMPEVAGTSNSGIPPLKLTLKKSSSGGAPEKLQPCKEKLPKKEKLSKIKLSPRKPKHPHKPKKRGRPLGSKPTKLTSRQRLLNIFKKGKGKKRGPRTESVTCSMPPTIRSIAKL